MTNAALPSHVGLLLRQQADQFPDSLAFQYLDDFGNETKSITFEGLYSKAKNQAAHLQQEFDPSDRVLLMIGSLCEFMEAFFACQIGGFIPVPVFTPKRAEPGTEFDFLCQIAQSTEASCLIAPEQQLERIRSIPNSDRLLGNLKAVSLAHLAATSTETYEPCADLSPEDEALILFTSGSTGNPKGVVLSHRNLMTNFSAFSQAFALTPSTPICTWLPNFHIAGLYTRLIGLLSGSPTIVFAPHAFLNRPALWLETISKYGVHMSAAPNFAYDLCSNIPESAFESPLDLRPWRMAISGGEVVQPRTIQSFTERFRNLGFTQSAFLPYFGMTETLCTTIPQRSIERPPKYFSRRSLESNLAMEQSEADTDTIAILSNGPLLGDTKAVIINPTTLEQAPPRAIGELWLTGKSITSGYWRQDQLNRDLCQATLSPDDGATYFRTGDLGFFLNGELFLTGRLKDLIIVNGKNYYPTDIEATVNQSLSQMGTFPIAAFPHSVNGRERLALALEIPPPVNPTKWDSILEVVRKQISRQHGLSVGKVIILPPQGLPRTRSGKIQRGECRRRTDVNEWQSWASSSSNFEQFRTPSSGPSAQHNQSSARADDTVQDELISLFSEELGNHPQLNQTSPINSLGIDSIGAVRLITQILQRWGLQLDYAIFQTPETIADLANTIQAHEAGSLPVKQCTIEFKSELLEVDRIMQSSHRGPTTSDVIFLTGATGFLGGYLLRDLLEQSESQIRCLVRAKNRESAMERLEATLENIGLDLFERRDRIEILCGSLDHPRFGLTNAAYDELARESSTIIHNGANVNFVAPYHLLHQVNVASNLDILKLATQHAIKPVHYVSTIGVFNGPDRDAFNPIRENNWIANPNRLFSGYSQSKWVAESIFRKAHEHGLPGAVYRPGLVMGDATTGYCHTEDFLCRFIKGCLQMGRFPDIPLELDMTPVDFVSRAMVNLIQGPMEKDGKSFHLINPNPIAIPDLARWFQGRGYSVGLEDAGHWHDRLAKSTDERNALFPLVPFLLQRLPNCEDTILTFFAKRGLNLDTTNTDTGLRDSGIQCPPVDDVLLHRYTQFFTDIGFLPSPRISSQEQPA